MYKKLSQIIKSRSRVVTNSSSVCYCLRNKYNVKVLVERGTSCNCKI